MIDNTNTNTNTSTNTNTNNNEQGASDLYERSLSGRESCFGFTFFARGEKVKGMGFFLSFAQSSLLPGLFLVQLGSA